jgi:aspartate/methionine/tyrosine aminotransferase
VVSSCLRERKRRRGPLSVLFPTPTWMTIPFNQVLKKGGRCGQVAGTFDAGAGEWTLDLQRFEEQLRRRPDAVFAVYPSNPTGRLTAWLPDALTLLARYDVPLLLDVTYESMRHDAQPLCLPALPPDRRNVFLIGSLSKRYAVPGLRTAYLIPPVGLGPCCEEEIEIGTMGVSVLSQAFAAHLLEHDLHSGGVWFRPALAEMARRCAHACERLLVAGFLVTRPVAGYYVFARLPETLPLSAREFRSALYAQFGVDTIPGDEFGDDYGRFVRLSVGNPRTFEEVVEASDRIELFVRRQLGVATCRAANPSASLTRAAVGRRTAGESRCGSAPAAG